LLKTKKDFWWKNKFVKGKKGLNSAEFQELPMQSISIFDDFSGNEAK
jgi:hypothetical protein